MTTKGNKYGARGLNSEHDERNYRAGQANEKMLLIESNQPSLASF